MAFDDYVVPRYKARLKSHMLVIAILLFVLCLLELCARLTSQQGRITDWTEFIRERLVDFADDWRH